MLLPKYSLGSLRRKSYKFVPMLLLCSLAISHESIADDKKKQKKKKPEQTEQQAENPNEKKFKGNTFIMTEMEPIVPVSINGYEIYKHTDVNRPAKFKDNSVLDFKDYFLAQAEELFNGFNDGIYTVTLGPLVVNRSGDIVYYEPYMSVPAELATDDAMLKQRDIAVAKITKILDKFPSFTPASKDGDKVDFRLTESFSGPFVFKVKNKKVLYKE